MLTVDCWLLTGKRAAASCVKVWCFVDPHVVFVTLMSHYFHLCSRRSHNRYNCSRALPLERKHRVLHVVLEHLLKWLMLLFLGQKDSLPMLTFYWQASCGHVNNDCCLLRAKAKVAWCYQPSLWLWHWRLLYQYSVLVSFNNAYRPRFSPNQVG